MEAALDSVDIVNVRENVLGVAVVVLKRQFDIHRIAILVKIDRARVDRILVLVEIFDERFQPAFLVKFLLTDFIFAFIGQDYL